MPYSPTTWVDGVTPVNATNLNKIEAGIAGSGGGGGAGGVVAIPYALATPASMVPASGQCCFNNLSAPTRLSVHSVDAASINWVSLLGTLSDPTEYLFGAPATAPYDTRGHLRLVKNSDGTVQRAARVTSVATPGGWGRENPSTTPAYRWGCSACYDSNRSVVVVFGGSPGGASRYAHTYEWSGSNWTLRSTTNSPSGRTQFAMAFDSGRGVVVIYGGNDGSVDKNETWEYDGTDWTNVTGTAGTVPGARANVKMAYDASRGEMIMYGGSPTGNQTWKRTGSGAWTLLSPSTTPPTSVLHSMCFDSARNVIVLVTAGNSAFAYGDTIYTYEWNGTDWTDKNPVRKPMVRDGHEICFDSDRGVTIMFGGDAHGSPYFDYTEQWNGTNWTQVSAPTTGINTPPGNFKFAMAYDAARKRTVMFGGLANLDKAQGETWTLAPQNVTDIAIDTVVSNGTLVATDAVTFTAEKSGKKGAEGRMGGALGGEFLFSTNTAAGDPGAGNCRFHSSGVQTENPATTIDLSNTDRYGSTLGPMFNHMATAAGGFKGYLRIWDPTRPSVTQSLYTISNIVNNGSYTTFTVTSLDYYFPQITWEGMPISVQFTPAFQGWLVASKPSDQSRINSNVLIDDTALQFPLLGSTKYRVRGRIYFDTTDAGDFKWAFTGPAATLLRLHIVTAAAGATPAEAALVTAYPSAGTALTATATTGGYIEIDGIINNLTAGTFKFRFAQNTATADTGAIVLAGSYLEYSVA